MAERRGLEVVQIAIGPGALRFDPFPSRPPFDGRESAVIVFVGLALAAGLLHGVVPRFQRMFEFAAECPFPSSTVCLFSLADTACSFWPLWGVALLLPGWMWKRRISSPTLSALLIVALFLAAVAAAYALSIPFVVIAHVGIGPH